MARSRPGLVTLALSAAAVLGYVTYRTLNPAAPVPAAPEPALITGETEEVEAAPPARQLVDKLPDFSLANLAGEQQSIQSWPDKPMLINFWATWCAPCLREIPMLKELQAARPDVQIVGVAIDRAELVGKFAADIQFNYPILIGQNEAWAAAGALGVEIYALPFTIFTAADGSILGVHTGELHAEHLDNFRAVVDDLAAAKITTIEARSRIAGRM
jgi:thiol-disulfide isomerase/thioredoxin